MNEQDYLANLSQNIRILRTQANLTQEDLAAKLSISFQAVSKWETGQSCPDIALLPALSDIFGVSLDGLFGRAAQPLLNAPDDLNLPWEDDGKIRGMVFKGRKLLEHFPHENLSQFAFTYEGEVNDVISNVSVNCGDVGGSIKAGGDVNCGDVTGPASAGGDISCGDVGGPVSAGGGITINN